ncbi:MAG: UDP-N-acetylmuramoyl-tripeptide--D-alanyl-D-alanine ligase [Phascolarctobacterium sp.]|nr:UDP-N-acetylmuramoyl-tripeptide--D-alanyl-D-alanine ligase [Phascolarctobacterium sp.]
MFKAQDLAKAMNAAFLGNGEQEFTGVSTDSRKITPGQLFVALKGESFDGHAYCAKAIELGAKGVVISSDVDNLPADVCVFKVADTLKGYQDIAHYYRSTLQNIKIFAITGSNGKTSTKDLLAACLAAKYNVIKTQANFNNEIGLPYTLLSIKPDTDIAVVEMGMRGLGQIDALCKIANPDSGLITNVGETHMEILGSKENIGKAKSEIVVDLPADGFAILNGDNEYVRKAADKTKAKVIHFGLTEACDYIGSDIVTTSEGTSFTCTEKATGEKVAVKFSLIGEHNVYNALSAIAGSRCYGVSLAEAANALANAVLTGSRQEVVHQSGITFINDAYNASPASMEAGLATLGVAKKANNARSIAVLADMLELGPISEDAHRRTAHWALAAGTDYIICYGEEAKYIADEFKKLGGKAEYFANREEAGKALVALAKEGDIILLKGSHSMQVNKMLELFQ